MPPLKLMIYENHVSVEFFTKAVENKAESDKAGRPIFIDVPYVHIQVPGDSSTEIIDRAGDSHIKAYPKAWAKYQEVEQVADTGTPLEEWPAITRSQAKELKYFAITTVEALAGVSDSNLQKIGPGYTRLRQKAKDYLDSADKDAKAQEWAKERDELQARIAELELAVKVKKKAKESK